MIFLFYNTGSSQRETPKPRGDHGIIPLSSRVTGHPPPPHRRQTVSRTWNIHHHNPPVSTDNTSFPSASICLSGHLFFTEVHAFFPRFLSECFFLPLCVLFFMCLFLHFFPLSLLSNHLFCRSLHCLACVNHRWWIQWERLTISHTCLYIFRSFFVYYVIFYFLSL